MVKTILLGYTQIIIEMWKGKKGKTKKGEEKYSEMEMAEIGF